jgi:hypothetical protein
MVSKIANDAPTPIGYELLSTKDPSPSLRGIVQGGTNSSPKASKDGMKELETLGEFQVLLTREELQVAMGPIFGGIAARCTEAKKKRNHSVNLKIILLMKNRPKKSRTPACCCWTELSLGYQI